MSESTVTTSAVNLTSIVDNQGENTLHNAINQITENGRELWIATAFFSLDALNMVGENLLKADRIRLLFGENASPRQRAKLLEEMRKRSDADLLEERANDPTLQGLKFARQLIADGKLEARVYARQQFHPKLSLAHPSAIFRAGSLRASRKER